MKTKKKHRKKLLKEITGTLRYAALRNWNHENFQNIDECFNAYCESMGVWLTTIWDRPTRKNEMRFVKVREGDNCKWWVGKEE